MRCIACDCQVEFGEEYCEVCQYFIYEYNIDLYLEEEEESYDEGDEIES